MLSETVLRLATLTWLIALTRLDLCRRELPHSLTTLPLLLLGATAGWLALAPLIGVTWPVHSAAPGAAWDVRAILLAFAAILFSDTWLAVLPALASGATVLLFGTGAGQVTVVAWLLSLALEKAGVWGAGDAKVVMILLALFPDIRLGALLLGATGILGLGLVWFKYRAATPFVLRAIVADGWALRLPARTNEAGDLRVPLLPLLAIGAALFLLLIF